MGEPIRDVLGEQGTKTHLLPEHHLWRQNGSGKSDPGTQSYSPIISACAATLILTQAGRSSSAGAQVDGPRLGGFGQLQAELWSGA